MLTTHPLSLCSLWVLPTCTPSWSAGHSDLQALPTCVPNGLLKEVIVGRTLQQTGHLRGWTRKQEWDLSSPAAWRSELRATAAGTRWGLRPAGSRGVELPGLSYVLHQQPGLHGGGPGMKRAEEHLQVAALGSC